MSMITQKIFSQVLEHIELVIAQNTPLAQGLWHELLKAHPVDLAEFLGSIHVENAQKLFANFPAAIRLEVFQHLSHPLKVICLSFLDEQDRNYIITHLSIDDLTDFLDELSDED